MNWIFLFYVLSLFTYCKMFKRTRNSLDNWLQNSYPTYYHFRMSTNTQAHCSFQIFHPFQRLSPVKKIKFNKLFEKFILDTFKQGCQPGCPTFFSKEDRQIVSFRLIIFMMHCMDNMFLVKTRASKPDPTNRHRWNRHLWNRHRWNQELLVFERFIVFSK